MKCVVNNIVLTSQVTSAWQKNQVNEIHYDSLPKAYTVSVTWDFSHNVAKEKVTVVRRKSDYMNCLIIN